MRDLGAVPGEDFSTKSNHKRMLIAVTSKWLCKAETETRFGARLTSAMLDNGNMKNMLCVAAHSMDKDMRLHKRPNTVDETLGSTDIGMTLTSGTDCDNPLATEATCSRCRS